MRYDNFGEGGICMSILKKSTLVAMSALLVGTAVTPVSAYDNVSLAPVA